MFGKMLAHNIVDESTGEFIAEANSELTEDLIESLTRE